MSTPSLKEELKDWHDFDGAMHGIAISLGLFENQNKEVSWSAVKPTYWSKNPIADKLSHILTSLTDVGALEYDEAQEKWRWNAQFVVVPNEIQDA